MGSASSTSTLYAVNYFLMRIQLHVKKQKYAVQCMRCFLHNFSNSQFNIYFKTKLLYDALSVVTCQFVMK